MSRKAAKSREKPSREGQTGAETVQNAVRGPDRSLWRAQMPRKAPKTLGSRPERATPAQKPLQNHINGPESVSQTAQNRVTAPLECSDASKGGQKPGKTLPRGSDWS